MTMPKASAARPRSRWKNDIDGEDNKIFTENDTLNERLIMIDDIAVLPGSDLLDFQFQVALLELDMLGLQAEQLALGLGQLLLQRGGLLDGTSASVAL